MAVNREKEGERMRVAWPDPHQRAALPWASTCLAKGEAPSPGTGRSPLEGARRSCCSVLRVHGARPIWGGRTTTEDSFDVAFVVPISVPSTEQKDECRRRGDLACARLESQTCARTRMHCDPCYHSHRCHIPTRLPSRRGSGCVDKSVRSSGGVQRGGEREGTKRRQKYPDISRGPCKKRMADASVAFNGVSA